MKNLNLAPALDNIHTARSILEYMTDNSPNEVINDAAQTGQDMILMHVVSLLENATQHLEGVRERES